MHGAQIHFLCDQKFAVTLPHESEAGHADVDWVHHFGEGEVLPEDVHLALAEHVQH